MKLDPIDILILKELNEDGRASLRQIARKSSLSTPTVSSRFERMKRAGLIKKFVPVFNPEVAEKSGITALITLSAPVSKAGLIAKELSKMSEVYGVYIATGQNNLIAKVNSANLQTLQRFLTSPSLKKLGAEVIESQVIIQTVKDENPLPFADSNFQMNLRCDFCKGEITTSRPYTIRVASSRYYFCCKTCRKSYLEKHSERIKAINKREESK